MFTHVFALLFLDFQKKNAPTWQTMTQTTGHNGNDFGNNIILDACSRLVQKQQSKRASFWKSILNFNILIHILIICAKKRENITLLSPCVCCRLYFVFWWWCTRLRCLFIYERVEANIVRRTKFLDINKCCLFYLTHCRRCRLYAGQVCDKKQIITSPKWKWCILLNGPIYLLFWT